jgi:hypothetical protein
MFRPIIPLAILLAAIPFAGRSSTPPDLGKLEAAVANQFNEVRVTAGLKPLKFRDDLRLRMEACSVDARGPDPKVQQLGRKS